MSRGSIYAGVDGGLPKVGRPGDHEKNHEFRLKRLAASIDALAQKDAIRLGQAQQMLALRRAAAVEIHGVCARFVHSLNRILAQTAIVLDPEKFQEGSFLEDSPNLIQMNVRGRILQVAFESTPELVSTEDFRVPYTLAGAIRAFNQELLEKDLIEEQLLFFTIEKPGGMWRFFDARTYRSGAFDEDYLISLMEQLI
jgi:hypothetical protein